MNNIITEYGAYFIYAPFVILLIMVLLAYKFKRKDGIIFKGVTDIKYPYWLTKTLRRNNQRNGTINLLCSAVFFLVGYFFNLNILYYLGALALGISMAFFGYVSLNFFFPSSKIRFDSRTLFTLLIFILVIFYLVIIYGQFVFPTYAQDKVLGKIRVIYYMTGTSFYNVLVPLVILTIGKYRNTVASVILLFGFSILHAYYFLNFFFTRGNLQLEGYIFSFIVSFSITIFFLENIARFIDFKKDEMIK